jgi:hypothetical protein
MLLSMNIPFRGPARSPTCGVRVGRRLLLTGPMGVNTITANGRTRRQGNRYAE